MRNVFRFLGILAAACLLAGAASAQNVLVYDDNSNDGVAAAACANLGYACTVAGAADFVAQLTGSAWDLVVMDLPSSRPTGDWQTPLAAYVTTGGRAILTGWDPTDFTTLAPLFGVTLGAEHDPIPLSSWGGHALFTAPNVVPATMAVADDSWGSNGFYLTAAAGTASPAGFTALPTAGQAAIVIANGGRTIFNGFLFDDYFPGNTDGDAEDDVVELVENEMVFALGANAEPMSGIPAAGPVGLAVLALAVAGLGAALLGRRFLA